MEQRCNNATATASVATGTFMTLPQPDRNQLNPKAPHPTIASPLTSTPDPDPPNAPRSSSVRNSDRLDQQVILGPLPADDLLNDRLGDIKVGEGNIRNSGLVAVSLEVVLFVYARHFDKEDVGVLRCGQV